METLEFSHHIDEPATLLLWRLDDLIPFVLAPISNVLSDQAPARADSRP